jgi:uncharacterized protein (TIGR00252 family)
VITTKIGQAAEGVAALYLSQQGYQILQRNYRNRVCEIDIIAKKDKTIYFVEVKYRSSEKQGGGLEYITPKKLRQLHFAAQIWNQEHKWDGDFRLMAAAVAGAEDFKLETLVELE